MDTMLSTIAKIFLPSLSSRTLHPPTRACRALAITAVILLASVLDSGSAWAEDIPNIGASGQDTRNITDLGLRIEAGVDPSSLALNIRIPLGGYEGRAGMGLPVELHYNSKLWRVQTDANTKPEFPSFLHYANYSENSRAGWTSTLDQARVELENSSYDGTGAPVDPTLAFTYYVVYRARVFLPKGEIHELIGDGPIQKNTFNSPTTAPALYHAWDGSGLSYDDTSKVLQLPDGSRHLLGQGVYEDRHGNRIKLSDGATDTLGRVIPHPLAGGEGVSTYSLPGFNGSTRTYEFTWARLEHSLSDQSQSQLSLRCIGQVSGFAKPLVSTWPEGRLLLFPNVGDLWRGRAFDPLHNPVVLRQIKLPTGATYRFGYNVYGEIDRIDYPMGAYERFVYDTVGTLDVTTAAQEVTNRGVIKRYLSAQGDGNEVMWTYTPNVTRGGQRGSYWITTANPDGTSQSRMMYAGVPNNSQCLTAYSFDFHDALIGMPYVEDFRDASGRLLHRTLTAWEADDVVASATNGTYRSVKNPRPVRKVDILFDGPAPLGSLATYAYDANGNLNETSQ
jgi:hypothetical protein